MRARYRGRCGCSDALLRQAGGQLVAARRPREPAALRLQPDQAAPRRRHPDRAAAVGRRGDRDGAGRHQRGRSAARSARRPRRVVRVAGGDDAAAVVGGGVERVAELRHRRPPDRHQSGDERAGEERPGLRDDASGVEPRAQLLPAPGEARAEVLQEQRHPGQRAVDRRRVRDLVVEQLDETVDGRVGRSQAAAACAAASAGDSSPARIRAASAIASSTPEAYAPRVHSARHGVGEEHEALRPRRADPPRAARARDRRRRAADGRPSWCRSTSTTTTAPGRWTRPRRGSASTFVARARRRRRHRRAGALAGGDHRLSRHRARAAARPERDRGRPDAPLRAGRPRHARGRRHPRRRARTAVTTRSSPTSRSRTSPTARGCSPPATGALVPGGGMYIEELHAPLGADAAQREALRVKVQCRYVSAARRVSPALLDAGSRDGRPEGRDGRLAAGHGPSACRPRSRADRERSVRVHAQEVATAWRTSTRRWRASTPTRAGAPGSPRSAHSGAAQISRLRQASLR